MSFTHVALLRLGSAAPSPGASPARMKRALAQLAGEIGPVRLSRGNLFLRVDRPDAVGERTASVRATISEVMQARIGVLVRSRADLLYAMRRNPFDWVTDPHAVHLALRREEFAAAERRAIAAAVARTDAGGDPEEAVVIGRVLYLHEVLASAYNELVQQLSLAGGPLALETDAALRSLPTVRAILTRLAHR